MDPGIRGFRGFSLIEILVVITIIALLIAVSGGAYQMYVVRAEADKTMTYIIELESYAWDYNDRRGDFPPSSLKDLQVVSTGSEDNEGIEAFVLALFHKDYDGNRPTSRVDELANTDDDAAIKNVTEFGRNRLFEFVDAWNNPLIYIRHSDFRRSFTYNVEGEYGWQSIEVFALKDPETDTYYNYESFQLMSVGPDGEFDTEDDVANFNRRHEAP